MKQETDYDLTFIFLERKLVQNVRGPNMPTHPSSKLCPVRIQTAEFRFKFSFKNGSQYKAPNVKRINEIPIVFSSFSACAAICKLEGLG